jgi:hypothetical protein
MQRAKGGGATTECYFRFRVRKNILFILAFFLSAGLVEPVRFGYVQSVSDFENETEQNRNFFVFFNRLIRFFFRFGFFGYCFFYFLGLIGLSFFLLTPTLCHVL